MSDDLIFQIPRVSFYAMLVLWAIVGCLYFYAHLGRMRHRTWETISYPLVALGGGIFGTGMIIGWQSYGGVPLGASIGPALLIGFGWSILALAVSAAARFGGAWVFARATPNDVWTGFDEAASRRRTMRQERRSARQAEIRDATMGDNGCSTSGPDT